MTAVWAKGTTTFRCGCGAIATVPLEDPTLLSRKRRCSRCTQRLRRARLRRVRLLDVSPEFAARMRAAVDLRGIRRAKQMEGTDEQGRQ